MYDTYILLFGSEATLPSFYNNCFCDNFSNTPLIASRVFSFCIPFTYFNLSHSSFDNLFFTYRSLRSNSFSSALGKSVLRFSHASTFTAIFFQLYSFTQLFIPARFVDNNFIQSLLCNRFGFSFFLYFPIVIVLLTM